MNLSMVKLCYGKKSKGQALAEYGLILALVSVVCIGTLTKLGKNIDTTIGKVRDAIEKPSDQT